MSELRNDVRRSHHATGEAEMLNPVYIRTDYPMTCKTCNKPLRGDDRMSWRKYIWRVWWFAEYRDTCEECVEASQSK